MTKEERAALIARAEDLEEYAIRTAEGGYQNPQDDTRKVLARCAHADLKLKVAALLRQRAATP